MALEFLKKLRATATSLPAVDDLRIFHDVARALTSTLDLDTLLRAIMSLMEDYFGPEQWSLLMVDEETNQLYYALSAGLDHDRISGLRINMGEGLVGRVAATGQPVMLTDMQNDPEWSSLARNYPALRLESIVCQPIRHSNRTLAVLQLYNSRLDLTGDMAVFLRVLCEYTAIALENGRQVRLVHHLSITDDCTGLFNARYLYTSLESEIAALTDEQVRPIRPHFSLLFLDLDYFKTVNDTHGHLIGSRLLAEVGSLIRRTLGPEHAGFRYGGDEFVALLRGLNKREATDLALHIRETLRNHEFLSGEHLNLKLSASFGLATYPEDGSTIHDIIRSSDTMMYKAKADGRDRLCVAEPGVRAAFIPPKSSRHAQG
jgi:diguanylate cyclase (GGDEF)-like protein